MGRVLRWAGERNRVVHVRGAAVGGGGTGFAHGPERLASLGEDVKRQQTESAPVRLRVPKSPEPPAAVLLRDYFGVLITGVVVLSSFLFWVVVWLASGALATSAADKQTRTHAGGETGR